MEGASGTEHLRAGCVVPTGDCGTKEGVFSGWKTESVCRWGKEPDDGTGKKEQCP